MLTLSTLADLQVRRAPEALPISRKCLSHYLCVLRIPRLLVWQGSDDVQGSQLDTGDELLRESWLHLSSSHPPLHIQLSWKATGPTWSPFHITLVTNCHCGLNESKL